jgi:hypothetical protein
MQISYFSSSGCASPRYRICTSSSADFLIGLCGRRLFGSTNTILIALHPYYRSCCTHRSEKVRFATRVTQSALCCRSHVSRTHYPLLEPNNLALRICQQQVAIAPGILFRRHSVLATRSHNRLQMLFHQSASVRQRELGKNRDSPTPGQPSHLQQTNSANFQDVAGKAGS